MRHLSKASDVQGEAGLTLYLKKFLQRTEGGVERRDRSQEAEGQL